VGQLKVKDIMDQMEHVNVEGIIASKSDRGVINTRFGGANFAKAVLADETGEITLNLWREQTEVKVGDRVRIENGFAKFHELNVGRRGRIIIIKESPKDRI